MKTASMPASSTHKRRATDARQKHPHGVPIERPYPDGEADPDQPFEEGVHDMLDPDLRYRLISEAAFDLYTKRGFVDGYDLDDWLSAEARVDHTLLNPQFAPDTKGGKAA